MAPQSRLASRFVAWGSAVAVIVGAGIALAPGITTLVVALVLAIAVFSLAPRPLITATFAYLVFQDLVLVALRDTTPFDQVAKFADDAAVLALGFAAFVVSTDVRSLLRRRGLILAIALPYLAMAISSVMEGWQYPGALVDLALFSKPFFLLALGMWLRPDDPEVERHLRWILPALTAVVASGALFLAFPNLHAAYLGDIRDPDYRIGFLSAQSYFLSAGTYSWLAAASFAFCYAAYLAFRRRIDLVLATLNALFVLLSWRRKSILAVALILLVATALSRGRSIRLRAAIMLLGALLTGATILAPYGDALWTRTVEEYGSENPLSNARSALHWAALLIARDRFPFGTGFGSFGSHASVVFYSDTYREFGVSEVWGLSQRAPLFVTDTYWPMILGQGGVLALVGFAAFLALLASNALRLIRGAELRPCDRFIGLAALFVLAGSTMESVASHVYGATLQSALIFVPSALAWRAAATAQDDGINRRS